MERSRLIAVFIFYVIFLAGCFSPPAHKVPEHRFDDIERWVKAFEDPQRNEWQQPDKVVQHMNLLPGHVVADIGAGTGYFTRRFAYAVGADGKALGLDIELSMIHYMEEDARKLRLSNYEARLVKPDDPELSAQSVDVIFLCNTYHHIANRTEYFKNAAKSLKPGGRLFIVDFYKKELPYGPPPMHKLSRKKVIRELELAGYILSREWDFLPYQYFLEFTLKN